MYQNLINSLKKILTSKSTQAEKLLKISTLVDFAEGLDRPAFNPINSPMPIPVKPEQNLDKNRTKPEQNIVDGKRPTAPGALLGVEDIK